MKTTRPSFAWCVVAAVFAGCGSHVQAQAPAGVAAAAGSREQGTGSKDGGAGEAVLAAGQQAEGLMLRVRQLVDGYDSIECGTRHQIDLFDHQILGAGHYYQQGHGLRRLSRFELRSQIGNRTTTLFELSDGNYVWTFRENPAATTLTRVDLQRVAQALEQSRHAAPANAAREPAIGELPKLLEGIADDFRFERVVEGRLGDRPVWIVEGSWKPEKLIEAMPDQKGNIEAGRPLDLKRLPAQLPERIVLSIGQTDLFPCRVEYLRRKSNSATGGAGQEGRRAGLSRDRVDGMVRRANQSADRSAEIRLPTNGLDGCDGSVSESAQSRAGGAEVI